MESQSKKRVHPRQVFYYSSIPIHDCRRLDNLKGMEWLFALIFNSTTVLVEEVVLAVVVKKEKKIMVLILMVLMITTPTMTTRTATT